MAEYNPIEKGFVGDLHKIIAGDEMLHTFWHTLPDSGRESVERLYIEMIWQSIFAATDAAPKDNRSNFAVACRQFGQFIKTCVDGKLHAMFESDHFVALDKATYHDLVTKQPSKSEPDEKTDMVDFVSVVAVTDSNDKNDKHLVMVGLTDDVIRAVKQQGDILQDSNRTGSNMDIVLIYRPTVNELVKHIKDTVHKANKDINIKIT